MAGWMPVVSKLARWSVVICQAEGTFLPCPILTSPLDHPLGFPHQLHTVWSTGIYRAAHQMQPHVAALRWPGSLNGWSEKRVFRIQRPSEAAMLHLALKTVGGLESHSLILPQANWVTGKALVPL